MGLLDDAIKEHLDLKRRRGADPGEIERLEREALGPVRRLQAEESPDVAMPRQEAGIAYDEPGYEQEPYEEDELGPDEEYELEEDEPDFSSWAGTTPEPAAAPLPPEPAAAPPPPEPALSPEDLAEHDEPYPPDPADHAGVETAEYDVEAEHAHREGQEDQESDEADMLEETPEFFQDAPDHDRLWFEQRPPKDFDFDG